ncbi:MAG: hypothetical protein JWP69_1341 [Flaviaesturariibacter sp.]|nr:hypothetical protein [Flaviaesturariibacter sp.]
MKTSLSHLPDNKQQELQRVTKLIVETVDPEKIILFGSHATNTWVEDQYTEGHITYEYTSDYDLLVVTKEGERKADYEITDQIENRLRFRTPVNVITHDIGYVNKQLEEGQYFFSDIQKEGIMLFDAGNMPLSERRELAPAEIKDRAQKDFDKWFSSANAFLKSVSFNLQEKEYKIAAFELHQAAERTYNAIILVFTGYKPKTHNLEKLSRLSKSFSKKVANVFPKNTPQEEHLFGLLLKGYLDARYKDDYTITESELVELIERVKKLQQIGEEACAQKISSF